MIGMSSNKLADQLSTMPDQALPRMAQQYKDDAITLSMILSEKNRRDRVRQTGAAQQAQQPQAKVNDQVVASMQPLPETVGIGALPAPNMQGMAEGGIIAFGDGGDVPGYSGVGESLVRSTTGGKDYFLDVPETIRDPSVPYYRQIPNPLASLAGKRFGSREEAAQAYNAAMSPAVSAAYPSETLRGAAASDIPAMTSPTPSTTMPGAAPGVTPGAGGPRPSAAPAASRAPTGPTDFAEKLKTARAALSDVDPYAAQTTEVGQLGVARAQAGKAALEADTAKFDKAYEGREGRLSKREEEIGKQKESNAGLAFLNAGLAMMSTPGGLATAIGKGARVGTEQFASGLDKIRAAQERLDDARDKMEDLKLNRAEMSAKDIRQADSEIRSAQIDAKKLSILGAKEAGAKNDKMAEKIVDLAAKEGLTREEMQSRERAAATTASAYAGRLGTAGERLDLDRLRAQQKLLQDQIKETPNYGAGKAKRAELERALSAIQNQMAGGTIAAPSAATSPGGPVIDFMTGKPI